MNYKYAVTLLSMLLTASLASADVTHFYHTDYDFNEKPNDPAYNQPLIDAANDIDSYGLAQVSIEAIVLPASDNASFDGGKLMYLPRTMEFTNGFGLNPYMKGLIENQISDIDLKILREHPSKAVTAQLHDQQKALDKKIIDTPELKRLYILSLPYNELYADVIAVYHTQDRSAVFTALDNPNVQHNSLAPHPLACRDFAADNKVEGWSDRTPHGLFGPARTFLGQESCWPKTQEERSRKLKMIGDIILKEIKEKFEAKVTEADPSFNAALIQKLAPVCNDK